MSNIDFSSMFDNFTSGNSSDPIGSIYKIIPVYNSYQLKLLFVLRSLCKKWDLDDIDSALDQVMELQKENKDLDFFRQKSLQTLLAAYTQNEMIRGIKVQSINDVTDK